MALPKLNDSPSYSTTVPSTGKSVTFRPYLVKEEKVLMIAFETGQQNEMLRAVVDTIEACITQPLEVSKLTTFDIEYLFTQIRAKSVGEKSTIVLPCSECKHKNEVDIVVGDIKIEVPSAKEHIIQVTPSVSVEMKYPSYNMLLEMDQNMAELDLGFQMIANCIQTIRTEDEVIEAVDVSREDLLDFLESMTAEQFKLVSTFIRDMPTMKEDVKFLCESCGTTNEVTLQGIGDFLS